MSPPVLFFVAAAFAIVILVSPPAMARLGPVVTRFSGTASEYLPPFLSRGHRHLIALAIALPCTAALAVGIVGGKWWIALLPLVVLAAIGAAGPSLLAGRRRRQLSAQMAATVDRLGASCEAGMSFRSALDAAADDLSEPTASELRAVSREIALGGRLVDALRRFAERIGTTDAHLFAAVVAVQLSAGGDLGSSLRTLAERMSHRERVRREIRGMTAQARSTATIVAVLPMAAAVLAEMAVPGSITGMLGSPVGLAVAAASLVIQGFGLVLVRLVSRVPA